MAFFRHCIPASSPLRLRPASPSQGRPVSWSRISGRAAPRWCGSKSRRAGLPDQRLRSRGSAGAGRVEPLLAAKGAQFGPELQAQRSRTDAALTGLSDAVRAIDFTAMGGTAAATAKDFTERLDGLTAHARRWTACPSRAPGGWPLYRPDRSGSGLVRAMGRDGRRRHRGQGTLLRQLPHDEGRRRARSVRRPRRSSPRVNTTSQPPSGSRRWRRTKPPIRSCSGRSPPPTMNAPWTRPKRARPPETSPSCASRSCPSFPARRPPSAMHRSGSSSRASASTG